jgi:hypothetical protein
MGSGDGFSGTTPYISDMKVLDQHKIALLDSQKARILFFDHGAVYDLYENLSHPLSMDIQDSLSCSTTQDNSKSLLAVWKILQAKLPACRFIPRVFRQSELFAGVVGMDGDSTLA